VRVIAATNKSLAELVKGGQFRQDLYYRINVVRLELPPLRARKEDVPLLVDHFIHRFNQTQGRAIAGVSPEAMALLMAHDYPGNIRELENIIEHAFVICPGAAIGARCLPEALAGKHSPAVSLSAYGFDSTVKAAEAQAILDALDRCGGNRNEAAKVLGMHKSTLFRKVRALWVVLPQRDGRNGRRDFE
jgi:transcriptional regulator with PAS, ATPase and Fis domain